MKTRIHTYSLGILLLIATVLLAGCKKDSTKSDADSGPQVITLQNDIPPIFEETGGDYVVQFNSSGAWSAEVDQNWGSVSPSQGKAGDATVTLHATENDSDGERNATLLIHSGSTTQRLVFYQKQKNALTATSNRIEVEQAGREITVEVKANVSFDYEIEEAAQEWLIPVTSRAMTTTQLHFEVQPNNSPRKREGRITLRSNTLTEVVTVYQDGEEPQILLSEETPVMGSDGGTLTVELRSNVDCTLQLPDHPDWLREITTRSFSTYTYRFEVDPNEGYDNRTTRLVFTSSEFGTSQTVTLTQMQRNAILVSEDRYELEASAGTLEFKINTNVNFEVAITGEWLREAPSTRSLVEKTLRFTVDANSDAGPREALIRLTAEDVEQTIRVLQAGSDGTSQLRITHTKQSFTIPFFSGSSTLLYGTVFWGDGSDEELSEENSHDYSSGNSHTVTIELTGADSFTLPDLIGITELDLSEF